MYLQRGGPCILNMWLSQSVSFIRSFPADTFICVVSFATFYSLYHCTARVATPCYTTAECQCVNSVVAGWAWWVSYLFWRKQFGGFSSFTTCRNDEIQQLHSEHSDKNTRNSYIHNLAVIIWLSNLQNAVCAGCADTEDFSYVSLFWILTRVTRAVWIHFNM